MLFSKKKKLQRDRQAGLVFRWRGEYAVNRGGSTIAFIITSLVFAAGFVLLNVYAQRNTVPSRYRASMKQLGPMDDDLAWWVEKNSPFLPTWSENRSQQSDIRVDALLSDEIRTMHRDVYRFEDVEIQQIEIGNEEIYTPKDSSLPSLDRFGSGGEARLVDAANAEEEIDVAWELKLEVDGSFEARVPDASEMQKYGSWIPLKWRGRSVRFIIAVDAMGEVLHVNTAEWREEETVRDYEKWLHTVRFRPAREKDTSIATVVVEVTASPVIKQADTERGRLP